MGLGVKNHPDQNMRRDDLEYLTPLYIEMRIATEYLHCTHKEFLKLSMEERTKLIFYDEMKLKLEYHRKEKEAEAVKKNQSMNRGKSGVTRR